MSGDFWGSQEGCQGPFRQLGGIGGQEEMGTTEDETVGWHQQLNGHEFE